MATAPRNVLIPIDEKEGSKNALKWYLKNFMREGDCVTFIHIVEPSYDIKPITLGESMPVLKDMKMVLLASFNKGHTLCLEYKKWLREEANMDSKAFVHANAKPGQAIEESAKKHNANVILIGSRGISTIERVFMGSVSNYLVRHVSTPIIIIPPPRIASDCA